MPEGARVTYNLGFFLGPGLPLIFGSAAPAPGALLFTPFFLDPSVGGPMGSCEGVPLAAGVPGFDSEASLSALSVLDTAATVSVGKVVDVAGDSLAGDSSLTDDGSTIFLSLMGDTFNVARMEGLPPDFLRSLSFAGAAVVFVEVGMLVVWSWYRLATGSFFRVGEVLLGDADDADGRLL